MKKILGTQCVALVRKFTLNVPHFSKLQFIVGNATLLPSSLAVCITAVSPELSDMAYSCTELYVRSADITVTVLLSVCWTWVNSSYIFWGKVSSENPPCTSQFLSAFFYYDNGFSVEVNFTVHICCEFARSNMTFLSENVCWNQAYLFLVV